MKLSKNAMMETNSAVLRQFAARGLSITEGVAIDARLVRSVSHPISKEEIEKLREKREIPEGKLDRDSRPLKFSRDHESDWVVKNDKPHYGLKEHAAVDTSNGFVLATELTPSAVNDSIYLPYCVAASCHTEDQIKKVYADKGYYGTPNSKFLSMNQIEDGIMWKDTKSTKLTDYWEGAEQENLKAPLHCGAVLRDKPPAYHCIPGEISSAYQEYHRCHVSSDGFQSVPGDQNPWDSVNIAERSARKRNTGR